MLGVFLTEIDHIRNIRLQLLYLIPWNYKRVIGRFFFHRAKHYRAFCSRGRYSCGHDLPGSGDSTGRTDYRKLDNPLLPEVQNDRYCKVDQVRSNDEAEQGMDIVGYFNLDMTGYLQEGSDIHVHLMYTTQDSTIADYVYGFSHTYFPDMPIHQDWLAWGDSDYSSFNRNGYPAVHPFEDVRASSPYIHSRQDVLGLSVNSLEQSKRFTELNLGLVATLAGLQNHDVIENESITIALYPNPAKESVTILANDELQHVTVINLIGQSLAHNVVRENNKYVLDINQFPSGIYLLKISTKRGTATQRLVVL